MPYCAICNSWASSFDKTCPKCGHVFEIASSMPPAGPPWPLEEPAIDPKEVADPDGAKERNSLDGVVYLLKAGGFYKIGKTIAFDRRFAEIKLQLPFKVELVHQIRTNNINLLESHFHRHFRKKRRNGEWFALGKIELEEILSMGEVIYK